MSQQPSAPRRRDNTLDLLRGIAALNIILIHTAFWSGEAYVPRTVASLTLALDVPFFFFLSGWSAGYVRSLKKSLLSLVNIYLKYLVFLGLYLALLFAIRGTLGRSEGLFARNLLMNLLFQVGESTALPVVMGSIWFMPVYFVVLPLGALVLQLALGLAGGEEKRLSLLLGGALAADLIGLVCTWKGMHIPLLSQNTLFYLALFLLGLLCRRAVIPRLSWAAGLIAADLALLVWIGNRLGLNWRLMQDMKFPPNVIYFLYSLVTIIAALWLRGRLPEIKAQNPLCRIGRAALLFYFCQGIGGSLLMMVLPRVELAWYVKFPLAYCLNLAVTLAFVWLLSRLYRLVLRPLPKALGGSRERL